MAATIVKCVRRLDDKATINNTTSAEVANYLVEVSEPYSTPYEVVRATFTPAGGDTVNKAMPNYGSVHGVNAYMFVTDKQCEHVTGKDGQRVLNAFTVSVTWDLPKPGSGGSGTPTDTEHSKNVTIRVSGVESTIYTQRTKGDTPDGIYNAVGDTYPDPQEITLYDESITISYEQGSLDMDAIAGARGKINTDTVTLSIAQGTKTFSRTFAAHTLLIKSWDYDVVVPKTGDDAHTWSATVVILYRVDTWLRKLPQKGYRWLDDDDKLTAHASLPEYLDADGHKLAPGSEIVTIDDVQMNDEADLTTLLQGI